jgi:uncharacterized membrane protein
LIVNAHRCHARRWVLREAHALVLLRIFAVLMAREYGA